MRMSNKVFGKCSFSVDSQSKGFGIRFAIYAPTCVFAHAAARGERSARYG